MKPVSAGATSKQSAKKPTILWWRDSDFPWDIELHCHVITKLEEKGHTGVLVGFISAEGTPSKEFHAWDYVPLAASNPTELAAAILREAESEEAIPAGLSIIGIAAPDTLGSTAQIEAIPGLCASVFPDSALLLRVIEGGRHVITSVWQPDGKGVAPLALEFELDMVTLEAAGYAPFQPLHIGANSAALPVDTPPAADPVPEPAPPQVIAKPDPPTVVKLEIPKWVWVGGFLTVASILGATAFYFQQSGLLSFGTKQAQETAAQPARRSFGEASTTHLNLEVKRGTDGALDIRWDRSAAVQLGSQSGSLQINDNGQRTDVPLTALDLNSGKLLYVPRSGNIEIQLTLNTPTGKSQEAVRVINAGTQARNPVTSTPIRPLTPPAAQTAAQPTPRSTPATAVEPEPPPVRQQQTPTQPAAEASKDRSLPVAAASNQAAPPQTATSQNQSPALGQAAAPTAEVKPNQVTQDFAQLRLPQTNTPPPPSTAPVSASQQPPAQATQQRQQPAVRTPVAVPPAPSRQIMPVVPPHLRQLLPGNIVVQVQVSVDSTGRVIRAEAPQGTGLTAHLSRLAKNAAMQWKFEPATLDGKAVPGEHVIQFKFGR